MNQAVLVPELLSLTAARFPGKVGLICGDRRVTYGELDSASDTLAVSLAARGVERGDRVVICCGNTVETVAAFFGALKARAVAVIVNPHAKLQGLGRILASARPSALFADASHFSTWGEASVNLPSLRCVYVAGSIDEARLRQVPGAVRLQEALARPAKPAPREGLERDLATIIYTSGSTGTPKGVMLTHRNMLAATASIVSYLELNQNDVVLSVLPLAFNYGLYQMLLLFSAGGTLVLERSFAYPEQVLQRMAAEHVTGFPGVPTIWATLLKMPSLLTFDLSYLRFLTNAGDALSSARIAEVRRKIPHARFFSMYGQTECTRATYLPPADLERKPGSVGIPIPNTEAWIVDERGGRVGPGVVGELVIRGETVMSGYWENPEDTAGKLRPGPASGEQVLFTGDMFRMDDDGYMFFVARSDDIIKSRGEKVAPKEVEHVLLELRGVLECAVTGVPDEILGQAVKAFVVLDAGESFSPKDVQKFIAGRLEAHMVPKYVAFVPTLPKTDSGKIRRLGLS